MEKHILSSVGKTTRAANKIESFYDEKSQISYSDSKFSHPVVMGHKFGDTDHTATIENSDEDGYRLSGPQTRVTETIENSDEDGFTYAIGKTMETRSIETSDDDGIWAKGTSTKQTFTIENSDEDGCWSI